MRFSMSGTLVCLTAVILCLTAHASADMVRAQDAQDALDTISRTRMLSQKVTKEFYLFLFNVEPDKNAQLVRDDMALVKQGFANVTYLIRSMTNEFDAKLDGVNESIYNFESHVAAFEDVFTFDVTTTVSSTTNSLATTTSTTTTTYLRMYMMWPVETESQAMVDKLTALWEQYTAYVRMFGIYNRLYAYDFVDRKRYLNQELGKFAILRALGPMMPLGYNQDLSSHALRALLYRMDAFTIGHSSLLRGSAWLGNGMVPDVCLLYTTGVVTDVYDEKVLPELRRVIYRLRQTPADWERLDMRINELLDAVQSNYELLTVVEGKASPAGGLGRWNRAMECPHVRDGVNDNGWLNAISMLNNNRRVLQEVARIYLQVVKGGTESFVTGRIDRLMLRRDEFLTRTNNIITGSIKENVPSPPTQDLSETSQSFLLRDWRPVDEIFMQAIQRKAKTFDGRLETSDNTTLLLLDRRIQLLEDAIVQISSLYVRECPTRLRQRCFMVEASYNQATAYERMVKEAWYCSLFENSTAFLQRFNYTKDNLTAATVRLVDGVTISPAMIQAENEFWSFKIGRQIMTLRGDPETTLNNKEFTSGWRALAGTDEERKVEIQKDYITGGTDPDQDKVAFQEDYHVSHRNIHPYYKSLLELNNYADLFMFDAGSNLVYSVKKNVDFGTNFETGQYSGTHLASTLEATFLTPAEIQESSWGKYKPGGDEDAAFICSAILEGEDVIGVLCIQLPPEKGMDLPRTESYCILNELYLVRIYELELIELVESVVYPKNWTSDEMAKFTGAYFNDLYPKFRTVTEYYSQAEPTCYSSRWLEFASIEQWRVSMATASMLGSYLPKVTKEYLVAQKMEELDGRSATIYARGLRAKIQDESYVIGSDYLRDLRLGTLDRRIPAAPAQKIVVTDLEALDAWSNFVDFLQKTYNEENVIPLGNVVYEAMRVFRANMESFTTYARRCQHSIEELEPGLFEKTGVPTQYIEQMAMEAAMLSLWQGSPANLSSSVENFEASIASLQSDTRTTAERCRVQAISRLLDSWEKMKPKIEKFGVKFTYDEKQLAEMMNGTETLFNAAGTMQSMFEDRKPSCILNDSGGVRSLVGLVTFLSGFIVLTRSHL